jgi:hypothetical protein
MAESVICRRCGSENLPEANFCSSCGAPLSDLVDQPTETLSLPVIGEDDAAGVPVAGFHVSRGPKAGSRYLLDIGTSTMGRHPRSTFFFDDVTVSRRHVEADYDGTRVVVRDVGSLNGTYVNQQSVEGDVELVDGDILQIGKFKLVFFREDPM